MAVEELEVLKPRLQNSEAETAAAKREIQRLSGVLAQRQTEYATAEKRNQQLTGVSAQSDADRAAAEKQLQRLTTLLADREAIMQLPSRNCSGRIATIEADVNILTVELRGRARPSTRQQLPKLNPLQKC